jgi:hypothetical protein
MRWEAAKIVIDYFAFLLVTTDLYGRENLERLTARLATPLMWGRDFLRLVLRYRIPPFSAAKFGVYEMVSPWQRRKWQEESRRWYGTDEGKKWAEKEYLAARLGLIKIWGVDQAAWTTILGVFITVLLAGIPAALVLAVAGFLIYALVLFFLLLLRFRGLEGLLLLSGAALFTLEKIVDFVLVVGVR